MKNVKNSFPSLVAFSDYLDNTVDVMEVDSLLDLMNLNKKATEEIENTIMLLQNCEKHTQIIEDLEKLKKYVEDTRELLKDLLSSLS
jgi:hypothetical protein